MKISLYIFRIYHEEEFIPKNYKESNGELISPPWQFPARKSLAALSANLLFHELIHSAFLVRGHYSRHSGRVAHTFLFKRRHYVNRCRYQVEKPSCKMQLRIQSIRRSPLLLLLPTYAIRYDLYRDFCELRKTRESWKMRER